MEIHIMEWAGYLGTGLIALSMAMRSIAKFRMINLFGAGLMAIYGVLISSVPVIILNTFIVGVDIYYLVEIYSKKESFEVLDVDKHDSYLRRFLDFYRDDIRNYFPGYTYEPAQTTRRFFILRNMMAAGLFIANREDDHTLRVDLDYVIPAYRDFKSGKFIFHQLRDAFLADGYRRVIASGETRKHRKYLKKLGFEKTGEVLYEFRLTN